MMPRSVGLQEKLVTASLLQRRRTTQFYERFGGYKLSAFSVNLLLHGVLR